MVGLLNFGSKLTVTKKLDKVRLSCTICPINFQDLKITLNRPIVTRMSQVDSQRERFSRTWY